MPDVGRYSYNLFRKKATDCDSSSLRTKNYMNLNIRLQTMTVSQYKDNF